MNAGSTTSASPDETYGQVCDRWQRELEEIVVGNSKTPAAIQKASHILREAPADFFYGAKSFRETVTAYTQGLSADEKDVFRNYWLNDERGKRSVDRMNYYVGG